MGLVFTTIMQDDFDWGYCDNKGIVAVDEKEKRLEKFKIEFEKLAGFKPELLGQWYGHAVFDLGKAGPYPDGVKELILKSCDTAIFWDDSAPYEKKRLE